MLIISILLIISLASFCIFASKELTEKSPLSLAAWLIVLTIFTGIILCLISYKATITDQAILDYSSGKYKIEEVIQIDTTFIVKKIK